ncbi:VOC family protein [Nocardia crassostreae]|uniref:VOC family protein n=1 Tax=Nocardia crassostreae TaxID=53428 RepID=UPI000830862D|nr:VOC family protein [Nocardia crassostreae]
MLTTNYVPGTPTWIDLGSPDIDASVAFYGQVFGWDVQSAGPESGGYGFFLSDGKMVGGIGPLTDEGASPAWTLYFHTSDADATTKLVEDAGGAVRVPPGDVFEFGRMAAYTDPTGAEFAVWQPAQTRGMEVAGVPGALSWTELYTTDGPGAKDFYRAVFGCNADDKDMGEVVYSVVSSPEAEGADTGQGGIMQLHQDNLDAGNLSEWHPYFGVTDCDATAARATEAGAATLIPVMDVPGIGRMAMFQDPMGAPFAILQAE